MSFSALQLILILKKQILKSANSDPANFDGEHGRPSLPATPHSANAAIQQLGFAFATCAVSRPVESEGEVVSHAPETAAVVPSLTCLPTMLHSMHGSARQARMQRMDEWQHCRTTTNGKS